VVPEPGARVSHYRLIRRLGTGGMGEVYLAHDDKLDRSVAIKFLLGNSDERARKRLLTEARAVAALDHPNICSIHEIDADEWLGDFIVMQYVEGETLSVRLQRGRMLPGEALGMCGRIADALRAAHTRGIIHRDLKPQNVILTTSGDPKLLDFGLAKNISSAAKAAAAPTETQLTKPHAVLGTAGYMSPEQVRSHPADHRSDLFALGCVMYECLTGKRAFTGGTSADIHAQVLHRDPSPPSTLVPELAPSHDALVARLLEKDPAQRFQSAEEALGAIRALDPSRWSKTDGGSHVDPAPPAPRSRARTIALGVAIAVAVVALVLWRGPWFHRLPEAPTEARVWYERGVEAIREGRFWTARTNLQEAIKKFDGYALAYYRLAEAMSELDDAAGANNTLNRATDAIPYGTFLTHEEQLRTNAIRMSVIPKHNEAIAAYRELASVNDRNASAWLDLGRAQEAAGRRTEALESYQKALALDGQYAAAHLRRGVIQVQLSNGDQGPKEIEEAVRLYTTAGQMDGKVEALIREAEVLLDVGRPKEARSALDAAMPLVDAQNIFHRVRAKFASARVLVFSGNYQEAEAMSPVTVDEAVAAGLHASAASGLTDIAVALIARRAYAEADAVLQRAIDLAVRNQARRVEMRARMQRAVALDAQSRFPEAIAAVQEPLRYYTEHDYARLVVTGKNILVRANDGLENYAEAARLSEEVLPVARTLKDDGLIATTLESIAGQFTKQGRLPEALATREQIEAIDRKRDNNVNLPFDITNRAELLIRLGRSEDAEIALAEVTRKAAEGIDSFKERSRRVAALQALRATTARRWRDVESFAQQAMLLKTSEKPDTSWRWGAVLLEHARAQLGTSRLPASEMATWMEETTARAVRREVGYWVAQTLVARRQFDEARQLSTAMLAEPGIKGNSELQWRLSALTGLLDQNVTQRGGGSASIRAALREIETLKAAWLTHADGYFARPDLAELRQRLR
jgi:tetratricopeptide (TPR) repeat protein